MSHLIYRRLEGYDHAKCHDLVAPCRLDRIPYICLSPSHEISNPRRLEVVWSHGVDHVWLCWVWNIITPNKCHFIFLLLINYGVFTMWASNGVVKGLFILTHVYMHLHNINSIPEFCPFQEEMLVTPSWDNNLCNGSPNTSRVHGTYIFVG